MWHQIQSIKNKRLKCYNIVKIVPNKTTIHYLHLWGCKVHYLIFGTWLTIRVEPSKAGAVTRWFFFRTCLLVFLAGMDVGYFLLTCSRAGVVVSSLFHQTCLVVFFSRHGCGLFSSDLLASWRGCQLALHPNLLPCLFSRHGCGLLSSDLLVFKIDSQETIITENQ